MRLFNSILEKGDCDHTPNWIEVLFKAFRATASGKNRVICKAEEMEIRNYPVIA